MKIEFDLPDDVDFNMSYDWVKGFIKIRIAKQAAKIIAKEEFMIPIIKVLHFSDTVSIAVKEAYDRINKNIHEKRIKDLRDMQK